MFGIEDYVEHVKVSYLGFKALDMGFDAHLTVLYLGNITHEQEKLDSVATFLEGFRQEFHDSSSYVIRNDIQMFGPNKDIPVVRVIPNKQMWYWRKLAESMLWNASEFKEWNPHITIDLNAPSNIILPKVIKVTDFGLY
jgi:2'-5' RNA ligase